jgi:hypothetical protein
VSRKERLEWERCLAKEDRGRKKIACSAEEISRATTIDYMRLTLAVTSVQRGAQAASAAWQAALMGRPNGARTKMKYL